MKEVFVSGDIHGGRFLNLGLGWESKLGAKLQHRFQRQNEESVARNEEGVRAQGTTKDSTAIVLTNFAEVGSHQLHLYPAGRL